MRKRLACHLYHRLRRRSFKRKFWGIVDKIDRVCMSVQVLKWLLWEKPSNSWQPAFDLHKSCWLPNVPTRRSLIAMFHVPTWQLYFAQEKINWSNLSHFIGISDTFKGCMHTCIWYLVEQFQFKISFQESF